MPEREAGVRAPRWESAVSEHWSWRPEWTPERRMWWWYATFEHDATMQRLAAEARRTIRPWAPVDLIPTRWLHLTLAEVGYASEVPLDLAHRCARTAAADLISVPPVDLRIGPVDIMPGAVVLRVASPALEGVRRRLVAASARELLRPPVQLPFDPHVSVAYVHRDCMRVDVLGAHLPEPCELIDTGELVDRDWRPGQAGRTRLDHVSLVEVVRDQRHYRWTPRCRISLDGRRPAPVDGR